MSFYSNDCDINKSLNLVEINKYVLCIEKKVQIFFDSSFTFYLFLKFTNSKATKIEENYKLYK